MKLFIFETFFRSIRDTNHVLGGNVDKHMLEIP